MTGTLERHSGVAEYKGIRYEIVIDHWLGGDFVIEAVSVPGYPDMRDDDASWSTRDEAEQVAHGMARGIIDG